MEDWFGEVYVAKVPGALRHVPSTRLAPAGPVHGALSGVHESLLNF